MTKYTLDEFSRKIDISARTLRRWDKTGKFVAHRSEDTNEPYYTDTQYITYCKQCGIPVDKDNADAVLVTYKVKEFSQMIDKSPQTLSRWDKIGKLVAHRSPLNNKFYTYDQYVDYCMENGITIGKQEPVDKTDDVSD